VPWEWHLRIRRAGSVVRHIGGSLVAAMKLAKGTAPPEAAEIVACECVVHAETKGHANWELLSAYGQVAKGEEKKAIEAATNDIATRRMSTSTTARGGAGSCRSLIWA